MVVLLSQKLVIGNTKKSKIKNKKSKLRNPALKVFKRWMTSSILHFAF